MWFNLKSMRHPELVSVIIPTRNSDRTLQSCLDSIERQTHQYLEILIVDDRSVDNTMKIAEKYKATFYKIEGERTIAKNFASKRASGEFLLFLDSDMLLEPTVVGE